jgi:hypothetical protein
MRSYHRSMVQLNAARVAAGRVAADRGLGRSATTRRRCVADRGFATRQGPSPASRSTTPTSGSHTQQRSVTRAHHRGRSPRVRTDLRRGPGHAVYARLGQRGRRVVLGVQRSSMRRAMTGGRGRPRTMIAGRDERKQGPAWQKSVGEPSSGGEGRGAEDLPVRRDPAGINDPKEIKPCRCHYRTPCAPS